MHYNEKGNKGKTLQKWWNGLDVVFSLAPCFLWLTENTPSEESSTPSDAKRKTAEHRTFDGRVRHYSVLLPGKEKKQESKKRVRKEVWI